MSSDGDASCGGVVRLEAGVDGAKDGSLTAVGGAAPASAGRPGEEGRARRAVLRAAT